VRRKRLAIFLLVALVIGVAVAVGLRGRGAETPEKAIYALAEAVEHRDAEKVCHRLFASVFLPRSLARKLRVPEGDPGTPGAWEAERAKCAREFGRSGEFDSFEFEDPRVRDVKTLPIEPIDGIRRAASARATLGGSNRIQTLKLVDYRGSWKVVFIAN
jgi:hypothetical protein